MTEQQDIRWLQRFGNYKKAFKQLEIGVEDATERELSDLEKEGLIQRFEYTQELSWQVIKDFYEYLGNTSIQGSRDAFQLAVKRGLINSNCGGSLMESIKSRNKTVHSYNEETAHEIFTDIVNEYYQVFLVLKQALEKEQQQRSL
ncbi:MAG: HI0074 family nucleotidyltransferase substrate-binding subunit [Thermodesulfobacteriota bacterium]|nr:HI0074 family nucleotidyltransferase substrate-binding subunit [Thermodesulfobacteriota bacterium]